MFLAARTAYLAVILQVMIDRKDIAPGSLQAPAYCAEILSEYGVNPHDEPLFRMVWAPSRLYLFGGYWDQSGTFGYKRVPKYGTSPMWIMERWLPPHHYGNPRTWVADTVNGEGYLSIGPYPHYGEYEATYMFADPAHNYVPLYPDMVALSARGIWAGRIRKIWDIRAALKEEGKAKELLNDAHFEKMWESSQGVRKGLAFGAGGAFNHEAKVEDMKRQLLAKNIGEDARKFKPGFRQENRYGS